MVMPEPPYLEAGAAGRCAAGLLKGLRENDRIQLSAIAASLSGAQNGAPPPGIDVEIISVPPQDRLQAWSDLARRPLGYLSRGEFGERVRQLAMTADVLHLDQTHTAWCNLGSDVPSLLHLHYLARLDMPRLPMNLRKALARFGVGAAQRQAAQRHRFLVANSSEVASELRRETPERRRDRHSARAGSRPLPPPSRRKRAGRGLHRNCRLADDLGGRAAARGKGLAARPPRAAQGDGCTWPAAEWTRSACIPPPTA